MNPSVEDITEYVNKINADNVFVFFFPRLDRRFGIRQIIRVATVRYRGCGHVQEVIKNIESGVTVSVEIIQ